MPNRINDLLSSIKDKAKDISILYVEDEPKLREEMLAFLSKIFIHVEAAANGAEGLEKYAKNRHNIVLTDIQMPNMNGLELIREIQKIDKAQEIIIISAYTEPDYLIESIKLGVTGYIIKPIEFEQILRTLHQSINKLNTFLENEKYKTKLEVMVEERTKKVFELQNELLSNYKQMMISFVKMIEGRDTYTGGHSERVATYSRDIACAMGFGQKECDLIYEAGILHDIGKIITPDAILLKPGKLTNEEYDLIKEHVSASFLILSDIPMYKELADVVYSHHEYYDGSGYPRGLKGEEIPLFARIMTIADSFDAMTTSRVYKPRKSKNEAIIELQELKGIFYDSNIVDVAVDILKSVQINENISQEAQTYLDDARFAYFYKDSLTHLYNHDYFDFVINKSKEENLFICLHILYIRNFSAYNKKNGWDAGDVFLREFANYLKYEYVDFKIFRIFGDDFVLLKHDHQDLDIDKINSLDILKNNDLYCDYKHVNLKTLDINSYKDLEKL